MTENQAIKIIKQEKQWESNARICDAFDMAIQALEEIQQYREMEQRLKNIYGECDGLLEVVISSLERHENLELPSITVKSMLLTDEDVDMWEEYRAIGTVEGYKRAIETSKENYLLYAEYKEKVQEFEAIGTIEEFKALKEKNTPMRLAEHNFQDEVHHYLCPSCRNIVNCNQNYCEECGQALET